MNKLVIYTSIVGNFDNIVQPRIIDPRVDYICFIKKGSCSTSSIGCWQLRDIPFDHGDNRILSRYPKLLPHLCLPEYEYSLWIDGNVSIADQIVYDLCFQQISKGTSYAGVRHWGRDCAYDDAVGCLNANKANFADLYATLKYLHDEKFPMRSGLYENNVIMRKHHDPAVIKFGELWWSLFLKYVKRDQITHTYCAQKAGINIEYLIPNGQCARDFYGFSYYKHIDNNKNSSESIFQVINRKFNVLKLEIILWLWKVF